MSAAAREPRDLGEWRQAAASAQRGGGPVDFSADDDAELAGVAKHGKQPSPADGIQAEVTKYSSRRVHAALALVLTFIARGLVPEPADWQVGFLRYLYKNKGLRTHTASYRAIALLPAISKLHERGLARRVGAAAATDKLQGAENPGVDARHQLTLLGDVLARREVDAKRTILMTLDITKAFPRASRPLLFAVLRARGLGGSLLRAVVARTGARAIAPGLQPGVDGRRGSIDLGLFEGARA